MVKSDFGYNSKVEGEVIVTRADAVVNWVRSNSVWPMPMGLACCAIELMAAGGSRFDISRFENQRFGLELAYLRDFKGSDIAAGGNATLMAVA